MAQYDTQSWMQNNKLAYSPFGLLVAQMLGDLLGGIYHMDTKEVRRIDWANTKYIEVRWDRELATFDGDLLTRLVFLAHKHCVRISISPRSNQYLTMMFHPRNREGGMWERHPTIDEMERRNT